MIDHDLAQELATAALDFDLSPEDDQLDIPAFLRRQAN